MKASSDGGWRRHRANTGSVQSGGRKAMMHAFEWCRNFFEVVISWARRSRWVGPTAGRAAYPAKEDVMRGTMKKFIATMLAAIVVAAPAKAWAYDYSPKCDSYDQVASNATGGDWVGGLLMFEAMATVVRPGETTTTTTSTTTTGSIGASGTSAGVSTTVTTTTTTTTSSTTTQEPVGYYAMNDGSVYMINCITGESKKL
jgi:hypothetical protein